MCHDQYSFLSLSCGWTTPCSSNVSTILFKRKVCPLTVGRNNKHMVRSRGRDAQGSVTPEGPWPLVLHVLQPAGFRRCVSFIILLSGRQTFRSFSLCRRVVCLVESSSSFVFAKVRRHVILFLSILGNSDFFRAWMFLKIHLKEPRMLLNLVYCWQYKAWSTGGRFVLKRWDLISREGCIL